MSGFMSKLQKLSPNRSRDRIETPSLVSNPHKQPHKPLGRLPGNSATLPLNTCLENTDSSEHAQTPSDSNYMYGFPENDAARETISARSPRARTGAPGPKPAVKSKPRRYDRSHSETSLSDSGSISSVPSERLGPQPYKPGRRMSETSGDSDVFETSSPTTLTRDAADTDLPKLMTTSMGSVSSMRRGQSVDSMGMVMDWRSKPIDYWTTNDVVEWSSSLGIEKLPQIFRNAGITGSHLANITDEILVELGLRSIVDRRKFLAEVKSVAGRKLSSLWSIKQVSMKRRNLEKSTDKLSAHLESLQKLNKEQEKMISTSLYEIQQEQLEAKELLAREKTKDSLQECRTLVELSPIHAKLSEWCTDDVVCWLDNNGLSHFVSVFQDKQIAGKDLDDENLNFLDHLEGFDIEAREALLSAIYRLQNPEPVSTLENDLQKIQTDEDRQKYLVALQVAALEQSSMTGSMISGSSSTLDRSTSSLVGSTSTLYVGNLMGSSSQLDRSTDTLASPQSKMTSQGPVSSEPGRHPLKRSSPRRTNVYRKNNSTSSQEQLVQKRNSNPVSSEGGSRLSLACSLDSSLYNQLGTDKAVCVVCVRLVLLNAQLGFTVTVPERGKVIVNKVNNTLPLHKGDRLLEVCGISMALADAVEDFHLAVNEKSTVDLVIARDDKRPVLSKPLQGLDIHDTHILQDKLMHSENQWQELRHVLEELRDMDVESEEYQKLFPVAKVEAVRDTYKLQEQLQQLQTTLTNQVTRANAVANELETKECALKLAEEERDRAVNKLHQLVSIIDTDNKGLSYEEMDDTLPLWENLRSASKEDVLQALKDTIVETTRQKAYLDHLLGVVIEQAPYLLEDLDDVEGPEERTPSSPISTQLPEEWC